LECGDASPLWIPSFAASQFRKTKISKATMHRRTPRVLAAPIVDFVDCGELVRFNHRADSADDSPRAVCSSAPELGFPR
jgi:hypothetical protein